MGSGAGLAADNWVDRLGLGALHAFARLWHRCRGNGRSPLPPAGPAIVVANHPSHADPAFLTSACGRRLHFFHAREYYDVFLLRRLFARFGCIPVARNGRDVAALREALRRLRDGAVLCIFPEGDLSPVDHEPAAPPKGGAALLALRSRAPVYPARIAGGPTARRVLQDWLYPSPGVHVTFGPAVELSAYHHRRIDRKLLAEVTALFMHRIADLEPASFT